ncbi:hypothetical protein P4H27_05335 [Paenibacillus taichungensis]|uniref:hypothetical protein n=1 Tax=Paenibacillus taichungensis TaxID=484184 RepID=UPI0028719838|nr:hypothetical protein [Paenibacillus taichungensis]MDR9743830.1 hypothetical protein [Paenibacillus taichungensis]MEC0106357.1 hypothetical protein [Paenibacillus taichungensis]MEC0197085.1 hypothetical protein [Paenibacillus taichungensis]
MIKEIASLMLLSVVLFGGCQTESLGAVHLEQVVSPTKQVTTKPEQETNSKLKLFGSSEDEQVKLYANKATEDAIERVTLDINGRTKDFDWSISHYSGTEPQLYYTDLTGDGKEEAVIIIQTGRGTGLDNYEIHVVNSDNLSEIKVQRYEDIVAEHIESRISKNDDGTLAITVNSQGQVGNFNYDFNPAPDYHQGELAFGGVVIYTLDNHKIKLSLPGSIGISPTYVCDFNITYTFDKDDNEFIVDQIEVEPVEK